MLSGDNECRHKLNYLHFLIAPLLSTHHAQKITTQKSKLLPQNTFCGFLDEGELYSEV